MQNLYEQVAHILSLCVVAVFGWAVNLNSRVAVVESEHESIEKLLTREFDDVRDRLERIERNLDGKH